MNKDLPVSLSEFTGNEIEVIIRYAGQEYLASKGKVRSVKIDNDVEMDYGWGGIPTIRSSGVSILTIEIEND